MVKQFVAVTSLAGGLAVAGLALYIQMDSTALTSPTRTDVAPAIETPSAPAAVEVGPAGETIFEPTWIKVRPVDIVVPVPGLKKPAQPTREPPLATEPCSDWRDLGPKATDTAKGQMHRVRQLCVS